MKVTLGIVWGGLEGLCVAPLFLFDAVCLRLRRAVRVDNTVARKIEFQFLRAPFESQTQLLFATSSLLLFP